MLIETIRRASEYDLSDILAADRVCFPDESGPYTGDGVRWWVAEIGGHLAGYCALLEASTTPDSIYLARAGVLPWARGIGIQRRMIRAREAWGRKHGYHWAVTDTCGVATSVNLIKCGYLPWEPLEPWGLDEATYWWKRIAS